MFILIMTIKCFFVSGNTIRSVNGTFWTRRMWEACGPLRENLYFAMDYDLWLRMSQRARFERVETHIAKYRIHPEAKCFADNYGSRVELIEVSRRYWPSRWNPGHWIFYLHYVFSWGAITKHYADAERLLNTAMQRLAKKRRFGALTSFVMAHLKHVATPLMPGYPVALQQILVEGIGPRWFWRFMRRAYGTLTRERRVTLRLMNVTTEEEATIVLEADSIGYRHPQFRFWGKRGNEFILLRDWGSARTYGPVNRVEGVSDYGVHLRAGDRAISLTRRGSTVHRYPKLRSRRRNGQGSRPEYRNVTFGGKFILLGASLVEGAAGLQIELVWKSPLSNPLFISTPFT